MHHIFSRFVYGATSLQSFILPNFPTGFGIKAENISYMFERFACGASSIQSLTLSDFPLGFGSQATDMSSMFQYFAYNATSLTCFKFFTFPPDFGQKVVSISNMFSYFVATTKLQSLTLSDFPDNFGKVATNMSGMFDHFAFQTASLTSLKLPANFPTGFGSRATDMNTMFGSFVSGCISLQSLKFPDLPNNFGKSAVDMMSMFASFSKLTFLSSLKLPDFPDGFGSRATNMSYMFYGFAQGASNLELFTLSEFPAGFGGCATNMNEMFSFFAYGVSADYQGITIDWSRTINFTNTDIDTTNMFTNFNYGASGSTLLTNCNGNAYKTLSNIGFKDNIVSQKCVVQFDSNGGSKINAEETVNNRVKRPANPIKNGYKFDNWYMNSNLTGSPFDFNTLITNNLILYAKWTKIISPMPTPAPQVPTIVSKLYSPIAKKIYLKSRQNAKILIEIKTNKTTKIKVKSSSKNVKVDKKSKSITTKNNKVYNIKLKAVKVTSGTKKAKLTITAGSKKLKITVYVKKTYNKIKKISVKLSKKLKRKGTYQIIIKTAKGLYSVPTFKLSKVAKRYIKIDKTGKITVKTKKTPSKGTNKYIKLIVRQGSSKKILKLKVV
jgi:uncharacterized repeat protein (TIGR02543 family)